MFSYRVLPALSAAAMLGLCGCSSEVTSTLDPNPDREARLELVTGCMPGHIQRLEELFAFSALWRLNDGANPPDPAELDWSFDGTRITYTITLAAFRILGTIGFFLFFIVIDLRHHARKKKRS